MSEATDHRVLLDPVTIEEFEKVNYKPPACDSVVSPSDFEQYNDSDEKKVDLVVTVGGDGTVLWASRKFQNRPAPPMFTINRGKVGYMCNFPLHNCEQRLGQVLDSISKGTSLQIENLPRLRVNIENSPNLERTRFIALNEFMLDRGSSSHLMKVDISINKTIPLFYFEGDGLMVSTPNGSTAYQLSAGGSVIYPHVNAVSITPIAPKFNTRIPVVLPIDFEIQMQILEDSKAPGWIATDGTERYELSKGARIVIKRSAYDVPFIIGDYVSPLVRWREKTKFILERD